MRSSAGSVTNFLDRLKEGERDAVQQLFERYFQRLIGLARGKLRTNPRLAGYDEDVALSAFASFLRAVESGRFLDLHDRDDLWQILAMLAGRKAHGLIRREHRQRRGGGRIRNVPQRPAMDGSGVEDLLEVINREPTPQEAVEFVEECERLLDQLQNSKLRQVALWKLDGLTNEEIAVRLGCVLRTVERKLQAIRDIWESENRT